MYYPLLLETGFENVTSFNISKVSYHLPITQCAVHFLFPLKPLFKFKTTTGSTGSMIRKKHLAEVVTSA
jgi:hypothetical protein